MLNPIAESISVGNDLFFEKVIVLASMEFSDVFGVVSFGQKHVAEDEIGLFE